MKKFLVIYTLLLSVIYSQGISSKEFYFIDEERKEILTEEPNDFREIRFKVWYPSELDSSMEKVPLIYRNEFNPIYDFFTQNNISIPDISKTYWGGEILESNHKYPLIVYNHGMASYMEDNQSLFELLVEEGYVVVTVAHKYHSREFLDLDDNNIIFDYTKFLTPNVFPEGYDIEKFYTSIDTLSASPLSEDNTKTLFNTLENLSSRISESEYWAQDTLSALKYLENINDEEFKGLIDTSKYIATGYSYGGNAAGTLLNIDDRCIAGINIDGFHYGIEEDFDFNKPYFAFLSSTEGHRYDYKYIKDIAEDTFNYVHIIKSGHSDYSDMAKILTSNGFEGFSNIDNYKNTAVVNFINSIYSDFDFDSYLTNLKKDKNLKVY